MPRGAEENNKIPVRIAGLQV